jgi:hypothetical protein
MTIPPKAGKSLFTGEIFWNFPGPDATLPATRTGGRQYLAQANMENVF